MNLTPRAFDVLRYLIEHNDRVVEKAELFEQIWNERFVSDNALTRTVTDIRHSLGDRAESPRYIETVPKRGYRFIATVNGAADVDGTTDDKERNSQVTFDVQVNKALRPTESRPFHQFSKTYFKQNIGWRAVNVGVLVACISAVIALGGYRLASRETSINSLAVMPFVVERADPEIEYLADDLTATVVSNLSQLSSLKVMSRNSVLKYKGKEIDPRVVGRELGVGAVLLGRLNARGEDLSISLELVDTRDNRQLWGEQHNHKLSDLLQVQSDISRKVSERLRLRLTGAEQKLLTKRDTNNSEAYRVYLKGRYHLDKRTERDVAKSTEYFQQAVDLDPNYALAYAGLADSYFVMGALAGRLPKEVMSKAKTAAARALQLDEYSAQAHASFGWLLMFYDHDWPGAERELKRALELDPDSAIIHQYYAFCLATRGRFDEALRESRQALELDPLSLFINRSAGTILYCARQYDQAIDQLRRTTELDPNFRHAYDWLVKAYETKGLYDKAVEADIKQREVAGGYLQETAPLLRKAYAVAGWNGYWHKALEITNKNSNHDPYLLALIHLRLGERKLALEWLERACEEHICELSTMKVNPEFDTLRAEPRFQELQRRVGLVD
jgi:TolB-like protein/DNA-binding winged helix-turn-helix (wHTH) protein